MVDKRNNLTKNVSDDLEQHFPDLLFNTLIPRNVKLAESLKLWTCRHQLYAKNLVGQKHILLLLESYSEENLKMSDEGKMSKGLEALLGDVEKPNKNLVKNIKTEQIIPNRFQPRKVSMKNL